MSLTQVTSQASPDLHAGCEKPGTEGHPSWVPSIMWNAKARQAPEAAGLGRGGLCSEVEVRATQHHVPCRLLRCALTHTHSRTQMHSKTGEPQAECPQTQAQLRVPWAADLQRPQGSELPQALPYICSLTSGRGVSA